MGKRDAFVEDLIEKGVARYRGLVADDVLEEMRRLLGDALTTHPVASRLVDRARPRDNNLKSDDYLKGTLEPRAPEGAERDPKAGEGGSGEGGAP